MFSDKLPKSDFDPLPPVRHIELSRRIGWLNLLFTLFYLFYFVITLAGIYINDFEGTGIPIHFELAAYFVSFVSLSLSGILLLKKKRLGKKLTQLAGIAGILTICVFALWSLTLLRVPPYNQYPEGVIRNTGILVIRYALRFAYPIITSVILTRKSDGALGLD